MSTNESTPRVGRWNGTGWLCECRESMYNSPEADVCHFCHAVRPPLPETPAPRVGAGDDYGAKMWRQLEEMAQAVKQADADENAVIAWMWDTLGVKLKPTPAQVVGREPIAGVDDAGVCDFPALTRAAYERFAENYSGEETMATWDEQGAISQRMSIALFVAGFRSAALRAVPVEGRPLAAAITDHPVSVEDAVKLLREAEQELSGGEGNHEILGAECGVMADRLAALVTPTPSEDRPDAR